MSNCFCYFAKIWLTYWMKILNLIMLCSSLKLASLNIHSKCNSSQKMNSEIMSKSNNSYSNWSWWHLINRHILFSLFCNIFLLFSWNSHICDSFVLYSIVCQMFILNYDRNSSMNSPNLLNIDTLLEKRFKFQIFDIWIIKNNKIHLFLFKGWNMRHHFSF